MTSRQKGRKEVTTGPVLEEIRAIKAFYALHEIPTMVIAGPAEHVSRPSSLPSFELRLRQAECSIVLEMSLWV